MSIDKKTIEEKLNKLARAIELLEKYKEASREDFLVDFTLNSATLYNLILSIEIIVDIGNHIISETYQVNAKEYKEVIEKLGEYEITPENFAKENTPMSKFRNLIVHQYGEIDMKQVYDYLQKAPEIFRKFAEYYVNFIKKQ